MIVYFDIIQKTSQWFEIKHVKIGGTRAAQLHSKRDTDTLFFDLLTEMIEPYSDVDSGGFVSDEMERGNELEPVARELLGHSIGVNFLEVGWLQSDRNKLLGISPDGISECQTIQCEIKCPQAPNHLRFVISKTLPLKYVHQCIQAFAVNDNLVSLYFASYRPECTVKQLQYIELKRDSIINIGTEKTPIMVTISSQVEKTFELADETENKLNESINNLNF